MRCFCAQAQKQVDKCELYLAISSLCLNMTSQPYVIFMDLTTLITLNYCNFKTYPIIISNKRNNIIFKLIIFEHFQPLEVIQDFETKYSTLIPLCHILCRYIQWSHFLGTYMSISVSPTSSAFIYHPVGCGEAQLWGFRKNNLTFCGQLLFFSSSS